MYLSLQWLLPKTNNENRFSQMSDSGIDFPPHLAAL